MGIMSHAWRWAWSVFAHDHPERYARSNYSGTDQTGVVQVQRTGQTLYNKIALDVGSIKCVK